MREIGFASPTFSQKVHGTNAFKVYLQTKIAQAYEVQIGSVDVLSIAADVHSDNQGILVRYSILKEGIPSDAPGDSKTATSAIEDVIEDDDPYGLFLETSPATTTAPSGSSQKQDKGLSLGVSIAISAVAGLAFITAVMYLALLVLRRRQSQRSSGKKVTPPPTLRSTAASASVHDSGASVQDSGASAKPGELARI
jgi:hypothetical protein